MATSAVYRLLSMGERSTTVDGLAFPTAGRTAWQVEILAGRVDAAFTVEIEASPDGADGSWESMLTEAIAAKSATPKEITLKRYHRRLRARVTVAGGIYVAEVRAAAPFFDPKDDSHDLELLPYQVKGVSDRIALVEAAEDDVLDLFDRSTDGRLDADLDRADFLDRVKAEIARQAEHRFQRQRLGESKVGEVLKQRRELGPYADGLTRRIQALKSSHQLPVWYGR